VSPRIRDLFCGDTSLRFFGISTEKVDATAEEAFRCGWGSGRLPGVFPSIGLVVRFEVRVFGDSAIEVPFRDTLLRVVRKDSVDEFVLFRFIVPYLT
jgi:hypothetical protein